MPAGSESYVENFVSYMVGERKSKYTIKEYKFLVSKFLAFVGKTPAEVTPMDIERYKTFLASKAHYSKASQYLAIKAIKLFYKSLDLRYPVNLTPPRRSMHMPVYLNEEEASRLLSASKKSVKYSAVISVLAYTGIRVGELCNLRIGDVDMQEGIIYVKSGKGDKDRIVVMPNECVSALKEYLNWRISVETPHDFLFISNKKSRYDPSTVERMVKRLSQEAGINKRVTPHVLRHTFATSVLRNGGDIRFIQQILGHSSVATTQIYTHLDDNALKDMYFKHRPRY
ncbi:integrase / recombinase [Thermoplasma volcanium GSS1]|uniref:Tyrosine recombinase XerA n=1 Tax=Thermoplasma volcanium (strain ATCC 51530 / DSM 4299 / JCM 9571 / NBRC 15438 / GSS1) TaxID=273116 RepID=Q97C40_THEVO|nr:site-specific tyrosine recombinase/integron integrase [Thermoplasma volcanium]BAB59407.1 integrase / recombinase [Thermoplasma volcanium GSS1]